MPVEHSGNAANERKRKVLVCITEDWFAVSHFLPLLEALVGMGLDTAVVTRVQNKRATIEATGARIIPFDWQRGALRPGVDGLTAARLARVLRAERPEVIHAIALKPIALAAVTSIASPASALAVHLTGVGYAGTRRSGVTAAVYAATLRLIANRLRSRRTQLLVENPDDVAMLRRFAPIPDARVTMLGGAGVEPRLYPLTPPPAGDPIRAGFIGRLIWSKGADVLVEATQNLQKRGVRLGLDIGGTPDPENPRSVSADELAAWGRIPDVRLRGRIEDIAGFWGGIDLAVVPSRGGEGLPRALLEAACCGRPIIASDVPGCRHFVRDGIEGLLVPPGDVAALADAMHRIAGDAELRRAMAAAARARVLAGFTIDHVKEAIRDAYGRLLARPAR